MLEGGGSLAYNSSQEQDETSCKLNKNTSTSPSLDKQPVADLDDIKSEMSICSPVLSDANLFRHFKPASTSEVESQSQIVNKTFVRPPMTSTLHSNAPFSLFQQLPGVVLEDDENVSSFNLPPVSPGAVSKISTRNQKPTIPTLETAERNHNGWNVIRKTTLMLFIATVTCIVTYGLFGITVMLLDVNKVSDFFMEFLLVNHFINPFVYNFVNESFRDECRVFLKKFQRKPELTDG